MRTEKPNSARATPAEASGALPSQIVVDLIKGWRWFADVPADGIAWLAARTEHRHIGKGDTVYLSGDPATQIYGVISGVFRIYMATANGDEITLEEVVSGGWFPHMMVDDAPRYFANCVCQESAQVVTVPQAVIAEFAQRWPLYYRGLYNEFISRAVVVAGRIELLSLHNLNVRLAVYLLRMLRLRGRAESGGASWVPAFDSQAEVGARVGGTRQRVNAVLKSWMRRGLIELHKDGIRVLDVDGLVAEARKTGFDVASYLAGWHGGWQGRAPTPRG